MRHVIAILVMLVAASPALARTSNRTPSATERQTLEGTVNAEPVGIYGGQYLGVVTGISGGIFLNPDLILRATVRTAKSCAIRPCSYGYDAVGVSGQKFIANSLFVEGGLFHEQTIAHPVDSYGYDSGSRA